MVEVSRTARVIQNAKVALFFYCINLILQFFSRKIFLDYLGAELLGLNTTAQNLLQFLNLAESGIGTAVAFALYKPLSQGNRQEIIDIVSLQGWFYKRVGGVVIFGSFVLMLFFPWIFNKTEVPLIYVYGTFISFLISSLLGYFVNYKVIVLSADQKEYKITFETQSVKVIKVFIQMLAIWKLPCGYVWWMIIEVIASLVNSYRLSLCVKKEYPWLNTEISQGTNLVFKRAFLLLKIKQYFCHKMGSFVLLQFTTLLIYFFSSLTQVAIYGNYLLIMSSCFLLMAAISQSMQASVGNVVATKDKRQVKEVFWEIFTFKLFFTGYISCGFYLLSDSFITLWVGSEYKLSQPTLVLLILVYFVEMSYAGDIFFKAYGLFKDIWAPIVQSLICVVLSCILGYSYGISGVLGGVLISQVIIKIGWKSYFLYHECLNEKIFEYIYMYIRKLVLLSLLLFCICISYHSLVTIQSQSITTWFFVATMLTILYFAIGIVLFYLLDDSFNHLVKRFLYAWKNKTSRY